MAHRRAARRADRAGVVVRRLVPAASRSTSSTRPPRSWSPEPVFVPRGDAVRLLARARACSPGPAATRDVARTYFPADTTLGLAGADHVGGIAQVALYGDPDAVDQDAAASGCWPSSSGPCARTTAIRAVQLEHRRPRPQRLPGRLDAGRPSTSAAPTTPTGPHASAELFALDDGRAGLGLHRRVPRAPSGRWAQDDSASARSGSTSTAPGSPAVSASGTDLLVAPDEATRGRAHPAGRRGGRPRSRRPGTTRDRMWLLDRGAGRARVMVVTDRVRRRRRGPRGERARRLPDARLPRRQPAGGRRAPARRSTGSSSSRVRHDAGPAPSSASRPWLTLSLPAETRPRDPRHRLALADDGLGAQPTSTTTSPRCARSPSTGRPANVDRRRDSGCVGPARRLRLLAGRPAARSTRWPVATVIDLTAPERLGAATCRPG